jgi:hypothetical protein
MWGAMVTDANGALCAPCAHTQYQAHFEIARVGPRGESLIDIRVNCAECGEPFVFTLASPPALAVRLAITPQAVQREAAEPKRIIVPPLVAAGKG